MKKNAQMNSNINILAYLFQSQEPFSCGNCDKSFYTQHQLTRHELSHREENPITKNHASNVKELQKNHFHVWQLLFCKSTMQNVCFEMLTFFQCDHEGCGKEFHKRNQLKAHMCEHQPLFAFQWVTNATNAFICGIYLLLLIVVDFLDVLKNFSAMEKGSTMRKCIKVGWQTQCF